MPTFGKQLRSLREDRGITLEEVASATRIGRNYLTALEQDAFDELPGEVFAKGYVRAYAEHIGADAERLVEAFSAEQRSRAAGSEGPAGGRAYLEALKATQGPAASFSLAPRRRLGIPLLVAAVLVAGGTGAYFFWLAPSTTTTPEPDVPTPTVARRVAPAVEDESRDLPVVPPPVDTVAVAEDRPPAPKEDVAPPPSASADEEQPPPERSKPDEPTRASLQSVEPPALSVETQESVVATDATGPSIPESGVGTEIVDHVLQGRADLFTAGSKVYFWTLVVDAQPGDTIRHAWIHEGRTVQVVPLKIGGSRWRTYSRKTIYASGEWTVEARDSFGRVLARAQFTSEEKIRR